MNNDKKPINTEENAKALKEFILEVENNVIKGLSTARGDSPESARGRADSENVNEIIAHIESIALGDAK